MRPWLAAIGAGLLLAVGATAQQSQPAAPAHPAPATAPAAPAAAQHAAPPPAPPQTAPSAPAQHEPAPHAGQDHAGQAAQGADAAHGAETSHGADAAHGEPHEPASGEIFLGLFKHLEPHAVFAVWFGGKAGFQFVKPYVADAAGEPALHDAHGHPVSFHSRTELIEHYQAAMGGGTGYIVWNITTAQWIAATFLLVVMLLVAMRARAVAGGARRGVGFHMLESTVLYVRDQMVYPVMGKHHGERFLPLFLTQFFFILCMNLMGLIPAVTGWFGTPTANLAVTGGLAFTTLLWIHLSGVREHGFFKHWKNFIPHGVPFYVLPIIIPVELLGMIVKPAALTIRLFANMTAGHLVMLGFFGLFYLTGSLLVGWLPLAMAVGIFCLELFVAFVQAYIFTYLSIIFVGASVHPEH